MLGNGVSVSMAAKAYRLLRAVLMTATEDDRIIPHNPCRNRGAGDGAPGHVRELGSMIDAVRDMIGSGDIKGATGVLPPDGNAQEAD